MQERESATLLRKAHLNHNCLPISMPVTHLIRSERVNLRDIRLVLAAKLRLKIPFFKGKHGVRLAEPSVQWKIRIRETFASGGSKAEPYRLLD